jgi:hypothetical protein
VDCLQSPGGSQESGTLHSTYCGQDLGINMGRREQSPILDGRMGGIGEARFGDEIDDDRRIDDDLFR